MKTIELEIKGATAWIWFRDPKNLNTVDIDYLTGLGAVLDQIEQKKDLRSVVLATDANNFSVGLDLKQMALGGPAALFQIGETAPKVFKTLAELPLPTLCLFTGYCVGGPIEMAAGCDFRFASDNTKISLPGVKIGIFNPAFTAYRLPRLIGVSRTKELMIQAKTIDATTALNWGLVSEVHSKENLFESGKIWAEQINDLEPESIKLTKKLIDNSDLGFCEFEVLEAKLRKTPFSSQAVIERMAQFLKK